MTTGERIRYRRKHIGMTADLLAEKIGVSRSTVFRWENGDIEKVPGDTLVPIAKALGVTPAYLMGWEDEKEIHSPALTPAESTLLSDFRRLNDRGQNEALFQLRHLAETDEYKKSPAAGSLPAAR